MDLIKLQEFADTIKHCGDYGYLFINEQAKEVLWVAGDADFDEELVDLKLSTSFDDVLNGFKIDGVDSVIIEAEGSPDDQDGYTCLGQFGIDNWNEVNSYYNGN